MKKHIIISAVATLVSSVSVNAADLLMQKGPQEALSISPWKGFYAGINAGYGLNNINTYDKLGTSTQGAFTAFNGYNTQYIGGALAGGQLGYNHVFSNHIMLGGEADLGWADIYNNTSPNNSGATSLSTNSASFANNASNNYSRLGLDWFGTVRARLGYDMGKFLPYITGGFAYGGLSNTNRSIQAYSFGGANSGYTVLINGSNSSVSVGWALGAGSEYLVSDNWSVKAEYLYTSLGGITTPISTSITGQSNGNIAVGYGTNTSGQFGVHQVRAGLNYHAHWWDAAPVVAKF